MPLKIHYFAGPGRAEVARLCLTIGGIPFENVTYDQTTWPAFKPHTPFGQLPVLELEDGSKLAQSSAIDNYVAKLSGLYPQDPWAAALGDQAVALVGEMTELLFATFKIADADEKIKARQDLIAGPVKTKLEYLSKLVDKHPFLTGDKLAHSDLAVFNSLSSLTSGMLDGVPKDLLNHYPALKAYRNKIANVPEIKKRYEHETEGPRASYKPDV